MTVQKPSWNLETEQIYQTFWMVKLILVLGIDNRPFLDLFYQLFANFYVSLSIILGQTFLLLVLDGDAMKENKGSIVFVFQFLAQQEVLPFLRSARSVSEVQKRTKLTVPV